MTKYDLNRCKDCDYFDLDNEWVVPKDYGICLRLPWSDDVKFTDFLFKVC